MLFFTEMWERFSYYGMRALLVLYMVDYLIKRAQDGTTHVVGFAGLQHGLEWVFGPLAVQALASQVYPDSTPPSFISRRCLAACSRTKSWASERLW